MIRQRAKIRQENPSDGDSSDTAKTESVETHVWRAYAPIVFGVRLLAVFQQTAYVPDEFYQSTDVIHNFVLNETDVTWEWKYPIRTSIWMFPIALLARGLHLIHIYRFVNLELIFRMYTGLISAYGELKIIELAGSCFSLPVAKSCFHLVIFSWYQFYSGSRALNNPVEVTLFSLSFYQLEKDGIEKSSTKYLLFAGASIFIRSSGFACYLGLFLFHFWFCKNRFDLVFGAVVKTVVVLLVGLFYDFWWYRKWTLPLVNFLTVNVIDGVAVMLGGFQGGFSWYLVQGFPVINGLAYVMGVIGYFRFGKSVPIVKSMALAIALGWAFMEFGCDHKEFRYVHWSAPFFTLSAAPLLARMPRWATGVFAIGNLGAAGYLGFVHQRGQIDLAADLRKDFCARELKFTFYGPCCFMPGEYSRYCTNGKHLSVRQLACNRLEMGTETEVDFFHRDPAGFLENDLDHQGTPDFIMFFDGHEGALEPVLEKYNFEFYKKYFHAHFPNDDQTEFILVYHRK